MRFGMMFAQPVRTAALLALAVFWTAAGSIGDANAQDRRLPKNQAEVQLSFAPLVAKSAPAVVNVYVRRLVRERSSPFFDDPFFRQFLGRGFGIPRQRVKNSLGSGVIVGPDGVVVTNHHVIKGRGEAEIKIVLSDKREYPAKIVLKDERTDLAVLRLDAPGVTFPYLTFEDSDSLKVGDLVLAIGNPFGVGQTVTSGIISALARTRVGVSDYQSFIQTDAAINPGNSGGALIDVKGRLVGINTAIYSRTGGSHGIGFAIPANMVKLVVTSALQGTKVKRPWLGAKLQKVTSEIAEALDLDRPVGAMVKQVYENSPAERAGLRAGDVITGVNGKDVDDPRAFHYRFSTGGIGGKARLELLRGGETRVARVDQIAAPEDPPRDTRKLQGRHPFSGAQVANLSPALAEELSIDEDSRGVIVLGVERGSTASRLGLRPGDTILEINGNRVGSVNGLARIVERRARRWQLTIGRNGRELNVVVGG